MPTPTSTSFPLPLLEKSRQLYFSYNLTRQRLEYVNEAVETVLGLTAAQAAAAVPGLRQRLHPDDQEYAAECVAKLRADRLREDVELRLLTDEQETRWYCAALTHYQTPAGDDIIGGSVRDTTAEKHYVRNTEKFNAKKNATLEILSHDLAGPLHFMQTAIQRLWQDLHDRADARSLELLQVVEQTCRESVTLLQEFVDNEFMESVNVELNQTRVNLTERLGLLMATYQNAQPPMQLSFTFQAAPGIYAFVDENKLLQVFNNLISNAIKFTPDGGRVEVTLTREDDQHVLATVRDSGIGIPAALQSILFERFTKARRPGLRGEKSTGLGMSIIKTIVELHQGSIWFESAEGAGTTFFVRLPRGFPEVG